MVYNIATSHRIPVYLVTDTINRHYPLALEMIRAYATSYRDGLLDSRSQWVPLYNCDSESIQKAAATFGKGIWLFSNYSWSSEKCLTVSRWIKQADPGHITVHGGPSIPAYPSACQAFLRKNSHVDIAVRGEGELTCAQLLEHFFSQKEEKKNWQEGLTTLKGISWLRSDGKWMTTPDQPRVTDLDQLPSPLLSGGFDLLSTSPNFRWFDNMPVMTNRGCPFGCAFCDWGGATSQQVVLFDLERVKGEIQWVARHNISNLVIIDANMGRFDRDVAIAAFIAEMKSIYGYPKETWLNYGKTNLENVLKIQKILVDADINCPFILAVQTRSAKTLKTVNRAGIRPEYYDALLAFSRKEKIPLTVDLILGLPGATLESFKEDIQFYFDRHAEINTYRAQMVVNSPMAAPDYMETYQVKTNANGLVTSCFSYSEADYHTMVSIAVFFRLFSGHGILKYFLRFLQWDFNIPCKEFLHRFVQRTRRVAHCPYGFLAMLHQQKDNRRLVCNFISQSRQRFFDEILQFTSDSFGLDTTGSDFETIVAVNQAVIPYPGGQYPLLLDMEHDVAKYYRDRSGKGNGRIRLCDYPAARFEVRDRFGLSKRIGNRNQWDHFGPPQEIYFELESSLMSYRSSPRWLNANQ